MKTQTLLLTGIALFGLAVTSCKKEKVKGCTTSSATNFNSSAQEDDGSCAYNGKATFWIDSTSASNFAIQGIGKIKIHIGGTVAGTYDFVAGVPIAIPSSCGESGYVSVNLDMGGDKITNNVVYTINNASNDTIISASTTTLEAGVCMRIHITH